MKPAPFEYRSPESVPEVVALLAEHGDRASVLAGGQSLLLELRYRTRRPAVLVDINRIRGLAGLAVDGGRLRVGALARHADLERFPHADPLSGLLRDMARHVAHPPIRALGTFAGSVAWANPAAEWCALAAALEATVTLAGPAGERVVAAGDWFRGPFRTARRPDEVVTEVRLPLLGAGTVTRFAELRRTHASFAQAAVLVAVRVLDGTIESARIGLAGAAEIPLRAVRAEAALVGQSPSAELFAAAGAAAAAESDPVAEPHAPVGYRRHVLGVLTARCLADAVREQAVAR